MNPYLFIVGCPRSGTTLLRRMLDAHPLVAVIDETRWIAGFFEKRKGLTYEGLVTPKLVDELLEYDRFAKLEIGREELQALIEAGDPLPYSRFVTDLFDLYGHKRGKPLVGDKTPRYSRRVRTLHALWPEAKFIHLIRDGRDVCLSILNWKKADRALGRFTTWGEDPVTTAALWWEWHVREAREAGQSLGPGLYHEVRYESLVSQPADECLALCEFLNIPYDDAMLRFHEGRERTDPGLDAKNAWRPVTVGLRDWRTHMAAEDTERFEAAAGGLLDELNYPVATGSPNPVSLEEAARLHEAFGQAVRTRGQRLPEGWAR